MKKRDKEKLALETIELFDEFSCAERGSWIDKARENELFKYGVQWTEDQYNELIAKGHIPLVINRIEPAVELGKSMLLSNKPKFRVIPVEDSDSQISHAINGLFEYTWKRCHADIEMDTTIENFLDKGMGIMLVYVDKYADGGRGEVSYMSVSPYDVYVDPNSRARDCSDASDIIVSREYTKKQLLHLIPDFEKEIKKANSTNLGMNQPTRELYGTITPVFSGDYQGSAFDENIRGYERYTKIWINRYRVFEKWSGREMEFDERQREVYYKTPCWILNSEYGEELIVEENEAQQKIAMLLQDYKNKQAQFEHLLKQAEQDPSIAQQMIEQGIQPPVEPDVVKTTLQDIKENTNQIDEVIVPLQRIRKIFVIGESLIDNTVLPCSEYPIIFFMNKHTGSPFPLSDVELVKDNQRYINKMKSLILAHTQAATNVKLLVPRGSDVDAIKREWGQPNAVIEVDMDIGAPILAQPLPLPNELYTNVQQAKEDIDYQFGLFESMHGNPNQIPDTARGIMMVDEFGNRRLKVKQMVIEHALELLGRVTLEYIQNYYTAPKIFRILKPNNSMTQFAINKRLYDDAGQFTGKIENNVGLGRYDVYVEGGSMLPANRYAQLSFYMDAYEKGIVDRVEVLKKTEIFDKDGVLQRIDDVERLTQQVQQYEDQIKQLQGDMQTRERELFHSKVDNAVSQELYKAKDIIGQMKNTKELGEGKIAQLIERAGDAAVLEKERIILEERKKNQKEKE